MVFGIEQQIVGKKMHGNESVSDDPQPPAGCFCRLNLSREAHPVRSRLRLVSRRDWLLKPTRRV
jgi:hypothetical protein